jgi:hypothetical protein
VLSIESNNVKISGLKQCPLVSGNGGNFYRIIGGQEAVPHQYPYQVLIRYQVNSMFNLN